MTNLTAYVFTDLTEPVRAAARAAFDDHALFDTADHVGRRRAMVTVLPAVNDAAHIIAADVIGRVRLAMAHIIAHDVTCTVNFDDDAPCDCTWAALDKAMTDLVAELETPAPDNASPKWEGSDG